MEIRDGQLLVTVRLRGKGNSIEADALIDTGATHTVVPPSIETHLELDPYPPLPVVEAVTASGIIEAPVRVLESLEVQGIVVQGLLVLIHAIPLDSPARILLGMNFLQHARLVVDGKANTFEVLDP